MNTGFRTCILAVVTLLAGEAWLPAAQSDRLSIIPYIGLRVVSDSNIYLDPSGAKSSVISTFYPGVNIRWLPLGHEISLNYVGETFKYTEQPDLNNANHDHADLLASFNFPIGLSLSLQDNYRNTTDPATTELTERVKRIHNRMQAAMGCAFSRALSAKLTYTQNLHDYIQDVYQKSLNRAETESVLETSYTISPKLSLLADFGFGRIDYEHADNTNSSHYSLIGFGARGTLTPKTTGELKAGMRSRQYRKLTGSDVSTSVLALTTVTRLTERTNLMLSANRNLVESTFPGNLYYTATSAAAKIGHTYRKWEASIGGTYESNAYPNPSTVNAVTRNRQDSVSLVQAGLTYRPMAWFTAGVELLSKGRSSNFEEYNYSDTQLIFSTRMGF